MKKCPNCNFTADNEIMKFCTNCGTPMLDVATASQTKQQDYNPNYSSGNNGSYNRDADTNQFENVAYPKGNNNFYNNQIYNENGFQQQITKEGGIMTWVPLILSIVGIIIPLCSLAALLIILAVQKHKYKYSKPVTVLSIVSMVVYMVTGMAGAFEFFF